MDSFVYSLNTTVPIFLVMIVGWIIKKCGIIDDNFVNKANKYVFHVSLPVLLFRDLSETDFVSQFDIKFVFFCILVTIIMFMGIWGLTELFMRDDTMKGAFVQASCRSSAAILGIAFIQNMYDDVGMAPLMIVAAVPLFNIFSVIVLTFKANDKTAKANVSQKNTNAIQKSCINILKNPIIIGIVLGFTASLMRLEMPEILERTIGSIAQTATPIALICIGAGFEGRKAIQKIKPTLIASFIKIIGLALVFLPIAVWVGFRNQELVAILIMLASPTTVTAYIMAKNMHNDEVLTSSIVVVTTFLSSVTLTSWIYILKSFGLI